MIEYIYIVKCPGCEDEMFNFFTDARMQCDLLMSKKPSITQVEVERNDFGECTDSHDLGTVWSWEEAMKDTEGEDADAEPTKSIFTRDDLKDYNPENDPEFTELNNSVDCEPKLTEAAATAFIDLGDDCKMSREAIYDEIAVNKNDIGIPVGDLGLTHVSFNDGGHYSDTTLNVSMDRGIFYITEWHQSDDGDLAEGDSFEFRTFEEFWDKLTSYVDVEIEECARKPIPEGMTIEQLVEEMEENEDEVECALCNDLFDKDTCRKELNLGWLCRRCADDLVARGEGPVFKEDNYWDFLDEDLEELSFSEMVADSINHLINDLGKDSSAEDFADDVIADLENNYDIEVPEEPEKYRDWASAVACEVSRQLNNQLGEDIEPDELHDLGNEYDGGYPAETSEVSDPTLQVCPECGKETFDIETGICVDCGFN